jgi:hypothetical protein
VSYINTTNSQDCPNAFTYVNGTIDPKSFTYNGQTGDLGCSFTSYDGQSASTNVISQATPGNNPGIDPSVGNNMAGLQMLGAADRVGNAMGAVLMTGVSMAMPGVSIDAVPEIELGLPVGTPLESQSDTFHFDEMKPTGPKQIVP